MEDFMMAAGVPFGVSRVRASDREYLPGAMDCEIDGLHGLLAQAPLGINHFNGYVAQVCSTSLDNVPIWG